ncbi:MAG: rod shape-determining protein RodA [Betaproteobacteria bacterium SG8_40]|nr:MAG: rod shape-determining protein RodA [Betaproteobacteria bacterium SG8_40]
MILVSILLVMGLLILFSASGASVERVAAQAGNIGVALAIMWLAANIPLHHLASVALPLYIVGLVLLVAVELVGLEVNGAQRWLDLGFARVQPSELMKIAVPMMLAWYFDRYEAVLRFSNFIVATILVVIPVLLIASQPDLGTSLLVAVAGFYVLFLAGLSMRLLIGTGVVGIAALPFLWSAMHDYQRQRVMTLLDPMQDPLGAGYHTIQSTIAMGSGGVLGKGWLNGTQSHLEFLPERSTDFIFAVFGEEFGLLGNLVLILLFMLVIGRGLIIAANAPTLFARLLAGGVSLTFFTYVFVNMGMVGGLLPVVGVPLPLISYGGTSLVTLLFGIGLLMSIRTHRRLVPT